MKKFVLSLFLFGLFTFAVLIAVGGPAGAGTGNSVFGPVARASADPASPAVVAIDPAVAPNDIDTSVTILVSGFATDTPPAVSLVGASGATTLTGVSWGGDSTLTATVPWGMDSGTYDLVVSNESTRATLYGAFTVLPGIGQWNAGDLFGGVMQQLLMKPGDPNTLYALSGDVGLFRTTDGGENWKLIDCNVIANSDFVLDPAHPDWLYTYRYDEPEGLCQSVDSGDTFKLMQHQAFTSVDRGKREVFVSPHDPKVLFECSYFDGRVGQGIVNGLRKSVDGGSIWATVTVAGSTVRPVQSVAFDPSDASQMVLATANGGVYRSTNGGAAWSHVATPSSDVTELGNGGFVTYNPTKPGEVWFSTLDTNYGVFRSDDASLTSWKDMEVWGPTYSLSFPAANVVYAPRFYSTTDGDSWDSYGPTPWYGGRALVFSPGTTQTAYISDDDVGIRKTTNGGADGWPAMNQGLTGLLLSSMDVSRANPLRVYAAFPGPLGMFISDDGTNHWNFSPDPDMWNVRRVLEDPFDPAHVYVASDPGLFESTSTCATWTALGWNLPAGSPNNSLDPVALDPYTPGHLIGAMFAGPWNAGESWLYDSHDGGKTWQGPIPVTGVPHLSMITSIKFDPEATSTVYVTTRGTGLLRSTNHGANWQRLSQTGVGSNMTNLEHIAIATHPQHVLLVDAAEAPASRSFDGGATWQEVTNVFAGTAAPGECMFANNDSTRLYTATGWGLCFSSDVGSSWSAAAGQLGHLAITGLNWGFSDGRVLVYAGTKGGNPGTTSGVAGSLRAGSLSRALATTPSALVDAGIYRRMSRNVNRVAGADRYAVAVNLARKGWDPDGTKSWPGVKHVVIACGDPGKEADPLSAAGLAGIYDAPILLVKQLSLPSGVKTAIAEMAAKNPGLKVHIVGGTGSVPDARFTQIKAIAGVNGSPDRLGGADRYSVSAAIATRMVALGTTIPGVILVCAENPAAYYDALAASPIAYAEHMPMLSVRTATIPKPIARLLAGSLAGKHRYAASYSGYLGASAAGATRLTTSSNRYSAAASIAGNAVSSSNAWLTLADTGLAAKLSDSLTGGAFMGRLGGVLLFTDSTSTMQSAPKSFVAAPANSARIRVGWILGGTGSVTSKVQTKFVQLLQ